VVAIVASRAPEKNEQQYQIALRAGAELGSQARVSSVSTNLARWASVVAHPFVMVALMVGVATARIGALNDAAANIGIVALFAILPVAVLMIRQVRRGAWATADASQPHERSVLYAVGVASILGLVFYLIASRPHSILLRGSLVALALLLVCAVVTRWIKVSLHASAAALTATALILFGSPVGWAVAGVLPILCWSRLALGRHKPIELALGVGLGILAGVAMHFP
jgi:hypothetical protein